MKYSVLFEFKGNEDYPFEECEEFDSFMKAYNFYKHLSLHQMESLNFLTLEVSNCLHQKLLETK